MSKMRVAFYRAEYGQLDDKYIDFFSGKRGYSHCELVVDKTTMIGSHYLAGGVAEFHYNNVFASKYWDIVELEVPNKVAVDYAYHTIGVGYDTIGAVLQFHHIPFYKDLDKVWCSEHTSKCLNEGFKATGHILATIENTRIMPNDLFAYLVDDLECKLLRTEDKKLASIAHERAMLKPEIDRFGRVK